MAKYLYLNAMYELSWTNMTKYLCVQAKYDQLRTSMTKHLYVQAYMTNYGTVYDKLWPVNFKYLVQAVYDKYDYIWT